MTDSWRKEVVQELLDIAKDCGPELQKRVVLVAVKIQAVIAAEGQ